MKEKINAREREVLQHGLGNSFWATGLEDGRLAAAAKKFSGDKRRAERAMGIFGTRDPTELRKVFSGSDTHSLWLRDRKVRSQIADVSQ